MPNLAVELEQLILANRHIAEAEAQLRRMKANTDLQYRSGGPVQVYVDALRAAEKSLEAFYEHRDLILQVIEDIREGRLVDTGRNREAPDQ